MHDCMGQVRSWDFEAVIGGGGMGEQARSWDISGKVNRIGIGPRKHESPRGAPLVTFDHFLYLGEDGTDFLTEAPTLASSGTGSTLPEALLAERKLGIPRERRERAAR